MSGRHPVRRDESGETLIELIVAVSIIAVTIVAVLGALAAAVANATRQRTDTVGQAALASYAERARTVPFIPCATPGEYFAQLLEPAAPDGFAPNIASVLFWNGTDYVQPIRSQLTAVVTNSATENEIRVADAGFPSGEFDIKVGDGAAPEQMHVTGSPSPGVLSVQRSARADHPDAAPVTVCPRPPAAAAPGTDYQAQLLALTLKGPDVLFAGTSQPYELATSVGKRGPLVIPALSAVAQSAPARAGEEVTLRDVATLSGARRPAGTVTFKLYDPDAYDPATGACTGDAAATSDAMALTAAADGAYAATGEVTFTPEKSGPYRWSAVYSGDAANQGAIGSCDAVGQTITVDDATTHLTVAASPREVTVGGDPPAPDTDVTATATLTGGVPEAPGSPTGTVTFSLYGPDNANCSDDSPPQATSSRPLADRAAGPSEPFTFGRDMKAGTYRWIASYSGDDDNLLSVSDCNQDGGANTVTVRSAH